MRVRDIRNEFARLLKNNEFVIDKSGVACLEIVDASFIADEESIIGAVDWDYVNREIAWYESQSLNVHDIPCGPPAIWKRVATTDGRINSNYGWMAFSKENGDQFEKCLKQLVNNPWTRRAEIIYTRPSMQDDYCRDGMSDFCCTNSVQYLIRKGKMHAVVSMRSNDSWAGYRNDRAWQRHVLKLMTDRYNLQVPDYSDMVEVGDIHWNAGSLHVYSRQFYLVDYYDLTGHISISKDAYRTRYPDSLYSKL